MKKIAVILAGCGVQDGSEIHETVATLLAIQRAGHTYDCYAPDKLQHEVVDHTSNQTMHEERNVLTEAARIARGDIQPLDSYRPEDYDALVFPGGNGVAKNLFTYAVDGVDCTIDPMVRQVVLDTYAEGKPIGAICISPMLIVKAFEDMDVTPTVTLGDAAGPAADVEQLGGRHISRAVDDICVDEANRIVTTPAYMTAKNLSEAADGIEQLVARVIEMA
ncbi:MAG: isoprenoid biosynthesis glyoxalase ElbB [Thermoplasmatota archaeon]